MEVGKNILELKKNGYDGLDMWRECQETDCH
jgi:hypothetical protein